MVGPLHELELIKCWGNHAEFSRKLRALGLTSDLPSLEHQVRAVGVAWFGLGRDHLVDAKQLLAVGAVRGVYSRAYYAAYNFSKTVRFLVQGLVSLKGDDHRAVGRLPDDLADSSRWATELEALYEDRLRADYDNWSDTTAKYTRPPAASVATAEQFEQVAAAYLQAKTGLTP